MIKILHQEMEEDPCLSSEAKAFILAQVEALTQEMEKIRLRITRTEALTAG